MDCGRFNEIFAGEIDVDSETIEFYYAEHLDKVEDDSMLEDFATNVANMLCDLDDDFDEYAHKYEIFLEAITATWKKWIKENPGV